MTYILIVVMSMAINGSDRSKITIETPVKDKAVCEASGKLMMKEFKALNPAYVCEEYKNESNG
jgi:hypothetical protein